MSEEEENELSKKQKLRLKRKEKSDKKKKDKLKASASNFGIYEDVIDGEGIRFKYRKTEAVNYGLTDEEILLADEKELNRWVSLKKSQQYEDDEEDLEKYNRKGQNLWLKKKILKSIYGTDDEEDFNQGNAEETKEFRHGDIAEEGDVLSKKRKKNKKRRKSKKQKVVNEAS